MCISVYTYCMCTVGRAFCMVSLLWSSSPDHHQTHPLFSLLAISTLANVSEMQHSLARVQGSVGRCEIPVLKRLWSWSLILKLRVGRLKLEVEFIEMFSPNTSEMLSLLLLLLLLLSFFLGQSWLKFRYEECILSIVSNILWAKALSHSATPRRHEKLYQWSSACVCCPWPKDGVSDRQDVAWQKTKHMSVHREINYSMLFKPGIPKKHSDKENWAWSTTIHSNYYELYQHILFMSGIQYTIT